MSAASDSSATPARLTAERGIRGCSDCRCRSPRSIAVRWFVPLYRSGDEISAYYHLEQRFGPWARTYALLCYVLSQLARIGTILYLVALALSPLTGWDIRTIILVTGVLVTIYTLLGGIEAVIWTDVAQSFVLIAGACSVRALCLTGMPDGSGAVVRDRQRQRQIQSLGSFSLSPSSLTLPEPTFWIVLIYGVFINLQNFGIDQSFVQRYITAKSDRDAKFSVWLATLLFPIMSAVFFFIGTGLFSLYQANPEMLSEVQMQVAEPRCWSATASRSPTRRSPRRPPTLKPADIGDKVLPHFIVNKLPTGLAGLLIAAIFAAAMSSMDTSLNSSATLYLCDVHKRYFRPGSRRPRIDEDPSSSDAADGRRRHPGGSGDVPRKKRARRLVEPAGNFHRRDAGVVPAGADFKKSEEPASDRFGRRGVLLIFWLSLSPIRLVAGRIGRLGEPAAPVHDDHAGDEFDCAIGCPAELVWQVATGTMKLSLSCRIAEGFLSKEDALIPLGELCDLAVEAGYEAICMRPSQLDVHASVESINAASQMIRQRQLEVTMVSGDVDVVYNNDRGPNCLTNITAHLNLAEALGASLVRVCLKTEHDIAAAQCEADEAAERGITLVHQCHVQSLFETVDQIEQRLRQIDRPNFGLIFEAANLEECRQDYGPETIARLAPWIRNVYLQNQRLTPNGSVVLDTWSHGPVSFDIIQIPAAGGIDFSLVFAGLRRAGYDGIVTVHQSAPEDGESFLRSALDTAQFLKGLM